MITLDFLAQVEDLVRQADYGLLVTLANVQYMETNRGPLYEVMVPETEQARFGMNLVYEDFMLCATHDPIPAALATPQGIEAILRLARDRLSSMPSPVGYEIAVQLVLRTNQSIRQSLICDNPALWFRIAEEIAK